MRQNCCSLDKPSLASRVVRAALPAPSASHQLLLGFLQHLGSISVLQSLIALAPCISSLWSCDHQHRGNACLKRQRLEAELAANVVGLSVEGVAGVGWAIALAQEGRTAPAKDGTSSTTLTKLTATTSTSMPSRAHTNFSVRRKLM